MNALITSGVGVLHVSRGWPVRTSGRKAMLGRTRRPIAARRRDKISAITTVSRVSPSVLKREEGIAHVEEH